MLCGNVPPDWLIIQIVNRAQRLAKYDHAPTLTVIDNLARKESGCFYSREMVADVLDRLTETEILYRSPGGQYRMPRWQITLGVLQRVAKEPERIRHREPDYRSPDAGILS